MMLKPVPLLVPLVLLHGPLASAQEAIPIADLVREKPVDFAKEIYPLLKKNCIACHNSSSAKAKLNLESPKSILVGSSEGPVVIPGKPEESLLLQVASHREDPIMPPEKNKSNALPLTSEELGLLKLWIAEGAKGEAFVAMATPTNWILAHRNDYPVYHLALGPGDQFVAASRGQRVFIYDIRQGVGLGELIDPALAEQDVFRSQPPAHKDFVQSIAFSPEGWIATGGFRNVKLWRPQATQSTVVHSLPEAVTALETSLDGTWAAAGDAAGHVLFWKLEDSAREAPRREKWHEGKVSGLSLSPDGHWLATSGADGKIHLVKTDAGEIVRTHSGDGPWHDVLFLAEADRLIAASETGKITQWPSSEDGAGSTDLAAHEKPVTTLAKHPTEPNQILSGSADGTVKHWDLNGSKVLRSFQHGEPILDIAVSPKGHRLVSVAATSAKVWDAKDGTHLRDLAVAPEATSKQERLKRRHLVAKALAETRKKRAGEREKAWKDEMEKAKKAASDRFAAKGKRDEADRADHRARLARVESQAKPYAVNQRVAQLKKTAEEREARLKQLDDELAQECERSGDGIEVISLQIEEAMAQLETEKTSLAKAEEAAKQIAEAHKKVEEEAKKAFGALEAAIKTHNQAVENEELAVRLSQRASEAHTRAQSALTVAEAKLKQDGEALEAAAKVKAPSLSRVAYSADAERFALGRNVGGLLVYSAEGDSLLDTLADALAAAVASTSKGGWLTGTPSKEILHWKSGGTRWNWSRTVGSIDDPKALIDRVTALAFNPNGTLLATGSGSPSRSGQLKIWRVADGSLVMEMEQAHSDTIVGLEFSPDGQHVATASTDRVAKVFSIRDGNVITTFEGHTGHVLDVSWRADGLLLATAGADNVIKLWDFEEERQIKTISGYDKEITSVAFADTAEKLVSSSGDKSVRLGADRLDGKDFIYASALSQDGQWLIAAAQDSVVRVWQTKDKKLVQEFSAPAK